MDTTHSSFWFALLVQWMEAGTQATEAWEQEAISAWTQWAMAQWMGSLGAE